MAMEPEGRALIDLFAEDEDIKDFNDFTAWHETGMRRGWVTKQHCATHDGVAYTAEEATEMEDGGDPCQFVLRVKLGLDAPVQEMR